MKEEDKNYALKVLRELGFKPFFLGWYQGDLKGITLVEFVSYPYMLEDRA